MDASLAIEESMKEICLTELKEKQREAVSIFLQGRDTFVSVWIWKVAYLCLASTCV